MTRRRIELLVTLALGLLTAVLATEAPQPGKVYRIGWLETSPHQPTFRRHP